MGERRAQQRRSCQLRQDPASLQWVLRTTGITQTELADRVGLHKSTLSLIVSGRRNCTAINLAKIAKVLGCPKSAIAAKVRTEAEAA